LLYSFERARPLDGRAVLRCLAAAGRGRSGKTDRAVATCAARWVFGFREPASELDEQGAFPVGARAGGRIAQR